MNTFKDDMEKASKQNKILINNKYCDVMIFDTIEIAKKLKEWHIVYSNIKLYNNERDIKLATNTMFFKILYCLLTNSVKIIKNNDSMDCYNIDLDKRIRIRVINHDSDIINIRETNEYDYVVIFDCTDMHNYKMYEIDNNILYDMSELLQSNKFTVIKKYYDIKYDYMSSINDIDNDLKIFSVQKQNKTVDMYLNDINQKLIEISSLEDKIFKTAKRIRSLTGS
jgi:hypothetical protein